MEKRNKTLATIGTLISIIIIAVFLASIVYQDQLQDYIKNEATGLGYLFVIIVSAILEIIPQFIAPTVLMLNAAVLEISLLSTTLFIILGSTIGGIIGYVAGRKLGRDFAAHTFGKRKIKSVEKSLNTYGRWFVMFAALTPFPYVPIIFGALGMTKKNIILFGLIPRAISYLIFLAILELGIEAFF